MDLATALYGHPEVEERLIPTSRVCKQCYEKLKKLRLESEIDYSSDCSQLSHRTDSSQTSQKAEEADPDLSLTNAKEKANKILDVTESSPFTLHGIKSAKRLEYAKKKVEKTAKNLQQAFASALEVDPEAMMIDQKNQTEIDMDELINSIKKQLSITTSYRKRVQLLTLIPKSYTARQAAKAFQVTRHLAKKAINLRDAEGILATPASIKRERISDIIKDQVIGFYLDDENSRQMPGQKDCVSVAGVKHQKRLLLFKLAELYTHFKEKHGKIIGFSKFCTLRPKWCILVGASGTHTVCTCLTHENAKLLASETSYDYKVTIYLISF